ncbi:metal-response element-binding transcription factor 2-like isoform X2 [Limulus polyphemus]|uniref:Metal-response element-binding transcription factor 2-like isoform X2 n=1 Tax=Limulus polyphemus TaxID=6850 RepID=A0ABM1T0M6_LIMPO|nr:metal-response element-binding transcription factor 2-like isoform X2 [Limulus polyphemus]
MWAMSESTLDGNTLEGLQTERKWPREFESDHQEESVWTQRDKCVSLVLSGRSLGQSKKKRRKFREGLDVLCRWTDGLLYLGVIIKVDEKLKRALVRFEDSSEYWTLFKDMQRGTMPGGEIVCVKCEIGESEPPNEIVICDHCNLGYHQRCHRPKISAEILKPEVPWFCRNCIFASTAKLHSLTWDAQHKSNSEQCYCYCGGPGEWYLKMLQCCRCKQWFHEACLQCLDVPLLYGDRFYIFVCSVCNIGPEFLTRLALKWTDVAHLIMFNLTIQNNKKYFDIDTSIVPFLNSNWSLFQLQGEPATVPEEKRREILMSALHNNRSRFKCGKEIKKKTTLWGLRVRIPPPAPSVILPAIGPINEKSASDTKGRPKKEKDYALFRIRKKFKTNDSPYDSSTSSNGHKTTRCSMEAHNKKRTNGTNSSRSSIKSTGQSSTIKQEVLDGDDMSSFTTLDTIIPPPINFEGVNHPFMDLDKPAKNIPPIRPIKHQLSEDDIQVFKNREVKKKVKKVNDTKKTWLNGQLYSLKNTTMEFDNVFDSSLVSISKNSDLCTGDQHSMVSNYLGSSSRIIKGEKFRVLARRVTSQGIVQYLIEWEGTPV